jgi:hypothetical protein
MTHSNDTQYGQSPDVPADVKITLHGPAELADALPYLLGFHCTDSVVLVAVHGPEGRFGGRVRAGLPPGPADWPTAARQLARGLVEGSARRGARPDGIVVYLCQEPRGGEDPARTMERLRPFAQQLRVACGALDVPVVEALCVSARRCWSYCAPDAEQAPREGIALPPPGTSAIAAGTVYAGLPAPGSLAVIEARLAPRGTAGDAQEVAFDAACAELVPRVLGQWGEEELRRRTLALARAVLERLRAAPRTDDPPSADTRDDGLLGDGEAAAIVLGLQDRRTRDRAAEWVDPADADAALRLWRALARRCGGAYADHAAPLLSLAGWVAWSTGDGVEARVALRMALDREPRYTFARLLYTSVNEGLDPEVLRRCLRRERRRRVAETVTARRGRAGSAGRGPYRHSLGGRRARTRR